MILWNSWKDPVKYSAILPAKPNWQEGKCTEKLALQAVDAGSPGGRFLLCGPSTSPLRGTILADWSSIPALPPKAIPNILIVANSPQLELTHNFLSGVRQKFG